MNFTDKLTIMVLIVNMLALIFMVYQSILNRDALVAAKLTISRETRSRHIEMLPKAHFVIHVDMKLSKWINDLSEIVLKSNNLMKNKNTKLLQQFSQEGIRSPSRLVDKFIYDNAPPWLAEIYVSSAQFYYNAKALQLDLWNSSTNSGNYSYIPYFIERCEESIKYIKLLNEYIQDIIPEPYLKTPASINDRKFLG